MQNIVYERKQNGEDFFSLPAVTYSCFGNCPANGLVTEQPQYFVVICIFPTWQNTETMLISNGLRLIFTCPLFLAQPITFHGLRHTWATLAYHSGVPVGLISQSLGHSSIRVTMTYLKPFDAEVIDRVNKQVISLVKKSKKRKDGRFNMLYGTSLK